MQAAWGGAVRMWMRCSERFLVGGKKIFRYKLGSATLNWAGPTRKDGGATVLRSDKGVVNRLSTYRWGGVDGGSSIIQFALDISVRVELENPFKK